MPYKVTAETRMDVLRNELRGLELCKLQKELGAARINNRISNIRASIVILAVLNPQLEDEMRQALYAK